MYEHPNCDSAGYNGECTPGEVKRYPLGGDDMYTYSAREHGAAILCLHHWASENRWRYADGAAQHDWAATEVYNAE